MDDLKNATDDFLVDYYRQGHQEVLDILIERYERMVYFIARKFIPLNHTLYGLDDLTQVGFESLCMLVKSGNVVSDKYNFAQIVFGKIKFSIIDYVNYISRYTYYEDLEGCKNQVYISDCSMYESIYMQDLVKDIEEMKNVLNDEEKRCIDLIYFNECDARKASEIMNVRYRDIVKCKNKALSKMRKSKKGRILMAERSKSR